MRVALLGGFFCLITSLAFAAPSEISISDETPPDVNLFGIQSKKAGQPLILDATTSATLEKSAPELAKHPLPPLQRDLLAQLLIAPEASSGQPPSGWMAERLRLLRAIGRPDEAWRLYVEIPSTLLTDEVAREGVNTAWSLGKTETACGVVAESIDTFGTSYWNEQQLMCAILKNTQSQIDFSLQLLEETAADKLSPVLKAIAENATMLPPLTAKDGNVLIPIGIYLRQLPNEEQETRKVPANFIDQMPLSVLPPDLLGWAGYNPVIPLTKRCDAAEAAYQQARIDAAGLRQVYQEVLRARSVDSSVSLGCMRADVLASIGYATTPYDRTFALSRAYDTLRQFYTDHQTRMLLSEEIREFTGRLPDRSAPVFLMLQAGHAHIEQKDRQSAENISDHLAALNTMQGRVGAFAMKQAIAFSFTDSYDITPPDMDDIPLPSPDDKTETVWHRVRVADVLEALNYPLPPAVRSNQFVAPQAKFVPVSPETLTRFQQAKLDNNKAAALLDSILLLSIAKLDAQSGITISQIIALLNNQGYSKEAYLLATEALLTPPH